MWICLNVNFVLWSRYKCVEADDGDWADPTLYRVGGGGRQGGKTEQMPTSRLPLIHKMFLPSLRQGGGVRDLAAFNEPCYRSFYHKKAM